MPKTLLRADDRHIIASLLAQLDAAHEREGALMRLLEEKDAQIRLVLEEQFHHPVLTSTEPRPEARIFRPDPESLNDVNRFDPDKDAEALKKKDQAIDQATRALIAALDETEPQESVIAEEQKAEAAAPEASQ